MLNANKSCHFNIYEHDFIGILTFMSTINFMRSLVKHVNSSITSEPDRFTFRNISSEPVNSVDYAWDTCYFDGYGVLRLVETV